MWLFIKPVEHRLDRPKDDVKRNAAVLPALHQRPVEWAEQKVFSAAADECILNFREVVVVVQVFFWVEARLYHRGRRPALNREFHVCPTLVPRLSQV